MKLSQKEKKELPKETGNQLSQLETIAQCLVIPQELLVIQKVLS